MQIRINCMLINVITLINVREIYIPAVRHTPLVEILPSITIREIKFHHSYTYQQISSTEYIRIYTTYMKKEFPTK